MDRIIDISEAGAWIRLDQGRLLLEREGGEKVPVALADASVLVLGHPQITISQPALAALAEAGGAVVVCDGRRQPVGMMLPLAAHSMGQERLAAQVRASEPLRKQLWKSIVQCKLRNQEAALLALGRPPAGLGALACRVRSGDPDNKEAQGARRYWRALFQDETFRREPKGAPPNGLLNYGYAILRAMAGRAACAAGLHPSIGLHHHNRYNNFTLADDLMEPLRPVVDLGVARLVAQRSMDTEPDKEAKRFLGECLLGCVEVEGETRSVADACSRLAVSLAQAFLGKRRRLVLPQIHGAKAEGGNGKAAKIKDGAEA